MAGHEGLTATYSQCRPQAGGVDRAFCWNTFTLPPNIPVGYYGVMWWWEFNGGEHYNSCAGLQVVATEAELTAPPAPPPPPAMAAPAPGAPPPAPACPPGGGNTNGGCPGQQNAAPDCRNDHNCCDPGFTCYRKNNGYSGCRTAGSCTPGEVFDADPPEFKTPWACDILGGVCNVNEVAAANAFSMANPPIILSSAEQDLYMQTFGDPAAMSLQAAMEEAAAGGLPPPAVPQPMPGTPGGPPQGAPGAPAATPGAGVSSAYKVAGTSFALAAALMQVV